MNVHYAETRNLVNKGEVSDSFARHFKSHFGRDESGKNDQISSRDVREITKVSILWQGSPISSMKTFGKLNCNLCMMERLEIIKAARNDKLNDEGKLINSSNEFYGACRHRTKFHRYRIFKNLISTDEGVFSPKRSDQYPDEVTQDLSLDLPQNPHYSPLKRVPVPVDTSNGNIVVDL